MAEIISAFNTYDLEDVLQQDRIYLNHLNTILAGDNHLHEGAGVLQNSPSRIDLNLCNAIVSKLMHGGYFLIEYDRQSDVPDCEYTIYKLKEATDEFEAAEKQAEWLRKLGAQTMAILDPINHGGLREAA